MRYNKISNSLFKKNRDKIIRCMETNSIAILTSSDEVPRNGDQFFAYRQCSDFFYLTGIDQAKSMLVLDANAKSNEDGATLFILKPDEKTEIWEGHKLRMNEAQEISGISNIQYIDNFDIVVRSLALNRDNIYLNINEYPKFYTKYPYTNVRFIDKIKSDFPLHNFKRLAPLLTNARLCKEPEEIELHQKACNITNDAFERVCRFIKSGVYEYEVEAEMTHEFIRQGANGHAYAPIVASGVNSCVLHYIENDKLCKNNDLILMDFGAEYANYAADTTRTIPVNGKFTDRQKEVYQAVLRVMKKAIKLIAPGNTINAINKEVGSLIDEELVNLKLLTASEIKNQNPANPPRLKYFMHGTSHFIGLDVHDVGTNSTILKPGMLLSCEPGIYIKEEEIGIRLEDDILVTENGQINLLAHEAIEINDIENLMKQKNIHIL